MSVHFSLKFSTRIFVIISDCPGICPVGKILQTLPPKSLLVLGNNFHVSRSIVVQVVGGENSSGGRGEAFHAFRLKSQILLFNFFQKQNYLHLVLS